MIKGNCSVCGSVKCKFVKSTDVPAAPPVGPPAAITIQEFIKKQRGAGVKVIQ